MNNKLIGARALWKNVITMKPVKQPQEFAGLCFEAFCSLVPRPEKRPWGLLVPFLLVRRSWVVVSWRNRALIFFSIGRKPQRHSCCVDGEQFVFCVRNVSQIKPKLVEVCSFSGLFWEDATLLLSEGSSAFSPVWKVLFLPVLFRVLLHILINGGITWAMVE